MTNRRRFKPRMVLSVKHVPQNSTDWRVREADLARAAPVNWKWSMKNMLMGMLANEVMMVMIAGGHTMFCTCKPCEQCNGADDPLVVTSLNPFQSLFALVQL